MVYGFSALRPEFLSPLTVFFPHHLLWFSLFIISCAFLFLSPLIISHSLSSSGSLSLSLPAVFSFCHLFWLSLSPHHLLWFSLYELYAITLWLVQKHYSELHKKDKSLGSSYHTSVSLLLVLSLNGHFVSVCLFRHLFHFVQAGPAYSRLSFFVSFHHFTSEEPFGKAPSIYLFLPLLLPSLVSRIGQWPRRSGRSGRSKIYNSSYIRSE